FGYVQQIRNRQDVGWTFSYVGNYLQQVAHTSGRIVQFQWNAGRLVRVVDPTGQSFDYSYTADAFGAGSHRLAGVTLPGQPATPISYHYENASFPGALTGKSYAGQRYSTFTYDTNGRVTSS